MTAIQFWQQKNADGRAIISSKPPVSFFDFDASCRPTRTPTRWLIRMQRRLILCADTLYPAIRFVRDDEPIEACR